MPSNQHDKGADVGWALTLSSPQRQGGSARSALAAKQHKTSSRNFKQPLGRSGLQTAKQASGGSPEVGGCAGKLTAQLVVDSRDRVSPSAIAIDRGLVADQLHLMACGVRSAKARCSKHAPRTRTRTRKARSLRPRTHARVSETMVSDDTHVSSAPRCRDTVARASRRRKRGRRVLL